MERTERRSRGPERLFPTASEEGAAGRSPPDDLGKPSDPPGPLLAAVPEQREAPTGPEDPGDLPGGAPRIEPMVGLGHDHEVGEPVRQRDRLGRAAEDGHVGQPAAELAAHPPARLDRDDRRAEGAERPGELPGPARQLHDRRPPTDPERAPEEPHRRRRVPRPAPVVARGTPVERAGEPTPEPRRNRSAAGGAHGGHGGTPRPSRITGTGRGSWGGADGPLLDRGPMGGWLRSRPFPGPPPGSRDPSAPGGTSGESFTLRPGSRPRCQKGRSSAPSCS